MSTDEGTRTWWQWLRRVAGVGVLAVALLALWWLWPARLGGSTTMVVVEGHSMEPTYHSGDLIVTRHEDHYRPGDVVVFAIPRPGSSHKAMVVHRLVSVQRNGVITTQGDNREKPDGFALTTSDIVGRAQVVLPRGGTILYLVSRWWMLALAAGLLVTAIMWPHSSITEAQNGLPGSRCLTPNSNT